MKYKNAELVFPEDLLKEIQKYVQGEMIYIPNFTQTRKGWGIKSGTRAYLNQRNASIRKEFENGTSIEDLAVNFFLSIDSIKRIVYSKQTRSLCQESL